MQFVLVGETGQRYRLESSTNLVDWTEISVITATNGLVPFKTSTGDRQRFFRAQFVP